MGWDKGVQGYRFLISSVSYYENRVPTNPYCRSYIEKYPPGSSVACWSEWGEMRGPSLPCNCFFWPYHLHLLSKTHIGYTILFSPWCRYNSFEAGAHESSYLSAGYRFCK